MVGIGPFITIPLLMASMGGPQSMLGWLTGALIVISDGLIWSELGAALPGSGGSYHFLREAYGHQTWGRLMAFLFIWQFGRVGLWKSHPGWLDSETILPISGRD